MLRSRSRHAGTSGQGDRPLRLRSRGRPEAREHREARRRRRPDPREGPGRLRKPARLALHARHALRHAPLDGPAPTERNPPRRRLRRHRGSGRARRHAVQAGRRGIRRADRRLRRVRDGEGGWQRGAEARVPFVRAGGRRAGRGGHGAPGIAPGRRRAGKAGADQRRFGRRRHVRGADRESARRARHRRLQHAQHRARALARRRRGHRLHETGLHERGRRNTT